ncbi:MAG TPA: alpha/beta fold hydrolase [Planctomycetota bacterium]|nr:alpha/beta fold hydrolase [Planctomycetota bacterium]
MRGFRGPLALLLAAACATTAARRDPLPAPLPLDRALGRPEGPLPYAFSFSRDNARVSYLLARDDDGLSDLWEIDIATGKRTVLLRADGATELSPEERAQRERRREHGPGITRYWRNPADDSFLFVIDGDLHVLREGKLARLTRTPEPELSPRWSPDGRSIAFVRARNLYALRDGSETQLTTAGGGAVECGLADFIAAEELGRDEGFWWSPDSQRIAYVETDASEVPVFWIPGLGERGASVEQRYPRPGDPNARWQLKVVRAGGGGPVPMQVEGFGSGWEYLVRAGWTPSGTVYAEVSDRLQRDVAVLVDEPEVPLFAQEKKILGRHDDAWVEPADLHFFGDSVFFAHAGCLGRAHVSETEMHPHPQSSPRIVSDVAGVIGIRAEAQPSLAFARTVVFTRTTGELGTDLKTFDLVHESEKTLRSGGWRSVTPSPDCSRFVEVASRAGTPPRVTVIDLEGKELIEIARGTPVPGLPAPEFFTIPAEDGTPLRAMLLRPAGKGPHPAIVHCYGGPGAQMVADRWGGSSYLWHARMAQMGYAILTVDNRGSAGYGDKVLKSVHGHLLDFEVRDQATAARWLGRQDFVDPQRIGIWGWSYGGTLSLMCLLKEPQVFAAAVAVAPVTDWRDYDTAYTERYLGLPADNPQGYAGASPLTFAATLKRPLLLAHGIVDDNVHFRHAAAFVEATQRAGIPVETDFYPKGAHGIGGPAERRLLFRRMEAFWATHLAAR